jgi:hypothetical protein
MLGSLLLAGYTVVAMAFGVHSGATTGQAD